MATAPAAEQTLEIVPVDSIRPSHTNPRQHFDEAGMAELGASIAESGIQVPLLVRSISGSNQYELVAGERRWRAAKKLGLAEVPCIVRDGMSDEDAQEAQIVENLQRADVHPIEEADAFNVLRVRLGSIPAVAAKVAKEQSYVAKCLRLLSLTLHSRDALRGGLITIDHALLLARLAEAEQNEALKWTLDRNAGSKTNIEKVVADRTAARKRDGKGKDGFYGYVWEPESVQKLKSHIESGAGVKLSRAPWKTEEEDCLLPDVVGCSVCDKNTKANAPLFGDLDIGDPTCTDGECFQAKTVGLVHIKLQAAGQDETAKPKKLVPRLSWKYSGVKPAVCDNDLTAPGAAAVTANPAKLLRQGQWVEAKKGSCPNARPGVTADWSDSGNRGYGGGGGKLRKPGETLLVCIAVGCKVHRKDYEKPKSSNGGQQRDTEAEKRTAAERDLVEQEETQIRVKVFNAMLRNLDTAKVIQLIADEERDMPAIRKELLNSFPGIGGAQLEALGIFVSQFRYSICYVNGYYLMAQRDGVAGDRKSTWALAKKVGVDANAVAAKHFHEADGLSPAVVDKLYPKGVPWPKGGKAVPVAAKKTAAKVKPKKAAPAKATKKSAKKKGAKAR